MLPSPGSTLIEECQAENFWKEQHLIQSSANANPRRGNIFYPKRRRITYQLQYGQISFPPQVFLKFRATSCQSIIHVHNDMNKRIHLSSEKSCPGTEGKIIMSFWKRGFFSSITCIIIFNSKNYKAQDMPGFRLQNIE